MCIGSIHWPIDGHLGYFQFLDIMKKTIVNICIQDFLWMYVFTLGQISRNGIAGSYGKCMFHF
jgi:hypothetical protein